MNPIQLIVTALVAGASNALESTASAAIKDAYTGLKNLIKNNYPDVGVDRLEKKPDSTARKKVVQEDLEEADAASNTELLQKAQALLDAFKAEPSSLKGVMLAEIEGASLTIKNIIVQGTGNLTGAEVKNSKFTGDLVITDVTVTNQPTSAPTKPTASPPKIKILFLAANPLDSDHLRLDEEARAIDEALRESKYRDMFELENHGAVRVEDLRKLLLRHDPHIVHFSGHGTNTHLILQHADGESRPVRGDKLADLFGALNGNTRCVVLNACYSEEQAAAIAQQIDFVIGMSDRITDTAARNFALAFYSSLGYGQTLKRAFELGCWEVDILDQDEAHKPILQSRIDPDTVPFTDPKV